MVEGLPPIKTSNGACIGCVVGKHLEHSYEKGKERRDTQLLVLAESFDEDKLCNTKDDAQG